MAHKVAERRLNVTVYVQDKERAVVHRVTARRYPSLGADIKTDQDLPLLGKRRAKFFDFNSSTQLLTQRFYLRPIISSSA